MSIRSISAYWSGVFLLRYILNPPVGAWDGFPWVSETPALATLYLGLELVSGIVAYDLMFFGLHYALHSISILKPFHRTHHYSKNIESRDTIYHDLVDGVLQVVVNIFCQRHSPWPWGTTKSRLARMLHNVVVTFMLVEAHTSYPGFRVFRRIKVCSGLRRHRHHHLTGEAPYQQFFGYLDAFFFWSKISSMESADKGSKGG
jgi:sterol desaturase/sphingolipid hydroxylase (fatty acid hydroxylase superfamily)